MEDSGQYMKEGELLELVREWLCARRSSDTVYPHHVFFRKMIIILLLLVVRWFVAIAVSRRWDIVY